MTFCLPNCWKCGRCWQAHLLTAQKPEQGDGEGKRDSLLDLFVLIMFKPDSKWLYIEWFRHIQTISNKYVQALHLFGRAFRRCPRVCVERWGACRERCGCGACKTETVASFQTPSLCWTNCGGPIWSREMTASTWSTCHPGHFLSLAHHVSSVLTAIGFLLIYPCIDKEPLHLLCIWNLQKRPDSHHATAVSRNNQQHLKSRIVSWKKHTRQKVNKISAHVQNEHVWPAFLRTGVCTKVI